jgi:hypothetical protein
MSFPVEEVIDDVQKIPRKIVNRLKTAASLKPGVSMMEAAAMGHPGAKAIRDAWQFQTNRATRVIVVSQEEFAAMVQKAGL